MLPKPQSVPFSSYIVFVIKYKVIFISKMHCALNRKLDNHSMCLVFPLCGAFAILKNKNVWLFSTANPVFPYFQYIFAHCFTSKLRKITKKDKEIKKIYIYNLILRKMIIVGLELTIPDSRGQCANHCATKDLQLSVHLSYL